MHTWVFYLSTLLGRRAELSRLEQLRVEQGEGVGSEAHLEQALRRRHARAERRRRAHRQLQVGRVRARAANILGDAPTQRLEL